MNFQRRLSGVFGFILMVCASALCVAETAATTETTPSKAVLGPHQLVDNVTGRLMGIVAEGKESLKSNPERFFTDVRVILESAVDFKYIARNVMGVKYWKSATTEQKKQFVEVFTSGLVETYAKGMANFADFEISVQNPNQELGDKKKVEVVQKFKGPSGVNRVSYTMRKRKNGEWKLINVVLDGVNLGKTLRAQFSQSVNESGGDLDAAITSWSWKG